MTPVQYQTKQLAKLNEAFMPKTGKYIIQDWAGNTCFFGKTFKSFHDADSFLSEKFEHLSDRAYEEERGEYYIEEVGNE